MRANGNLLIVCCEEGPLLETSPIISFQGRCVNDRPAEDAPFSLIGPLRDARRLRPAGTARETISIRTGGAGKTWAHDAASLHGARTFVPEARWGGPVDWIRCHPTTTLALCSSLSTSVPGVQTPGGAPSLG